MSCFGTNLLTAIVVVWNSGSPQQPEASSPQDQVRHEYAAALAKMQSYFAQVEGTATFEAKVKIGTPQESTQKFKISFARNGELKKLNRAWDGETKPGTPAEAVYCTNPRYAFVLRREQKDSPFIVRGFGKGEEHTVNDTIDVYVDQYLFAPFSVFGVPVATIMDDPSFSIRSVVEGSGEASNLLRIEYDYQPKTGILRGGLLVLARDHKWAIQSYETIIGLRGRKVTGSVEYAAAGRDGFAFPKAVLVDAPAFMETTGFRYSAVFDRITPRVVPEKEFTLTAFGLPELSETGRRDYKTRTTTVIFALAVGALIIAIVLKYLGSRRRGS